MANLQSLYDILGVEQTAPPEALRKAWKRKVLETHPDKLPPDLSEDERKLAEARFGEVHRAFEILNDTAKRRVYDNGLNYLRAHIRKNEAQERLARTREEWERQYKQRQEERIRVLREQQARAKEERERRRQEKLVLIRGEGSDEYAERMKALREAMQATQERLRENMMHAEMRYRERMKTLEEDLRARRDQLSQSDSMPRMTPRVAVGAFAMANEMLQPEALLEKLRQLNPEWEVRKQEALRRKAERTNSSESI